MAKKEMRMIVASDDIAKVIDHGFEVDTELKSLTSEDKGIKAKLTETLSLSISEEESSLRVSGKVAAVVITAVEKVDIDCGSESFPDVKEAIESGVLEGVVERKMLFVVSPADMKQAKEVLNKAGIKATISESLSTTAEALRGEALTEDLAEAMGSLKKCVKREKTYRVKYEKVQG